MAFDIEMIKAVYARFPERIAAARKAVGKPLTLTEKNSLRSLERRSCFSGL
ncbi:hypothetical protein [Algoriphagus boritolerans]|uniref:hypothetical protein n=1 Tax=Algoriphagus boritolerans TaxID=308111 RepID=UPI000A8D7CE8